MPSPVELALTSLLPTTSPLPPELLELSNSLLAQSRTRAASLKSEEEIGRTYACCHVACERLGKKLALEIGRPQPPVSPRVYEKLKTYLSSVLRTPVTPRNKRVEDKVVGSGTGTSRRGGGSVERTPTKVTSSRNSPSRPGPVQKPTVEDPQIMYTISKHLCRVFDTIEVHSHMAAAIDSVLRKINDAQGTADVGEDARPRKRQRTTSVEGTPCPPIERRRLPALVVALYLCVAGKRCGSELAGRVYKSHRDKAVKEVSAFCRQHSKEFDEGFVETKILQDVDRFVGEAESDWMKMEWYENVSILDDAGNVAGKAEENEHDQDDDGTPVRQPSKTPLRRKEKHARRNDVDEDVGAAGLLPGLGTMFQPAVDWLSDERRADYARWKESILQEIALIEQRG